MMVIPTHHEVLVLIHGRIMPSDEGSELWSSGNWQERSHLLGKDVSVGGKIGWKKTDNAFGPSKGLCPLTPALILAISS
ncbi:hypothetical protein Tco_0424226 [Tanacetum coccineum]